MTIKVETMFTPEVLITAPRRSPAVPNSRGTYALFTVSSYDLEAHVETNETRILNLETFQISLFSDNEKVKSPQWLVRDQILWLQKGDGGITELWIGTAGTADKKAYLAGTIAASIDNVRTKELKDGSIALTFSALADLEGALFNAETAPKPASSAREWESSLVRFWDHYNIPQQSSLWYTKLQKASHGPRYKLSDQGLVNGLKDTGIVFPVPGGIGGDQPYDMSLTGVLFPASDPTANPARTIGEETYYLPLESFTENPPPTPRKIRAPHFSGLTSAGVFSLNGRSIAFIQAKQDAMVDMTDPCRVFVVPSVKDLDKVFHIDLFDNAEKEKNWDRNPQSVMWSNDAKELYIVAMDRARQRLWKVSVDMSSEESLKVVPCPLTARGSVAAAYPLSQQVEEHRLLMSKTTQIDSSIFLFLDPIEKNTVVISDLGAQGSAFGLNRSQQSEFYTKGHGDYTFHTWVMKPSTFDKTKKYPLVMLVHGGPQSEWPDSWSTRWNPALWAEAGYVVVAPNPTGTTGFGHAFTKAVNGDWGGRPYYDLEKCFEYVEKNMPFVDVDRAIMAGASYGGFMANWIAGQPLGKKFKAIISHDGIFTSIGMMASDVTVGIGQDMGGNVWESIQNWDKYDPARFTHNWTTPMLFIHSDQDFRCPLPDGLAAYNVCQLKGIESRFLNFPDENHFVLKRENSLKWHRTVFGWANKFAKVENGIKLEPPVSEPWKKRW